MQRPLWRRPVLLIPAAIVIIGGAAFIGLRSGKSNSADASTVASQQLYTVQPATMQQTVSASGTIAPSDTEDLSFTSQGTVTAVNVKAGQQVKQGDVLATINSAALQSSLQQAQASYASANAQLTTDENGSASSAQITADQANVAAANANVAAAIQALAGANLTSPITGTVSTVNLTVGEVLGSSGGSGTSITGTGTGSGRSTAAGSSTSNGGGNGGASSSASNSSSSGPQIEVVSNSFVVNLSVDTKTVSSIKVGQAATVTPTTSSGTSRVGGGGGAFAFFAGGGGGGGVGGLGGRTTANAGGTGQTNTSTAIGAAATGTVTSVGTVASSSSGVATFPVVITVKGTPASFHAGASATAAIVYNELPNVLAVPVTALTQSNGASYVTVSKNGSQSKQAVTTGITSNAQIQITSGLQSGEQVVVTIPNFRRGAGTGTGGNTGRTGGFPGGGNFTGIRGGGGAGGTP